MPYRYQKADQRIFFQDWLEQQSELILIAMQKGYTKGQAIELLKVRQLMCIGEVIRES